LAETLNVLQKHEDCVRAAAFNPDGTLLASASLDKTVRIWDVITAEELAVLRGHDDSVRSVRFSPDGTQLASGSGDRTVRIWNAFTSEEVAVLKGHEGGVTSVVFSPDGARLATASHDHTLRLWELSGDGAPILVQGHEASVRSVVFSPDGKRLASGSDDETVRIWDAVTGDQLRVIRGHEGRVYAVIFSPDGARLASAGGMGSFSEFSNTPDTNAIRLWDVATGEEVAALRGHELDVLSMDFSPDGARLVSASEDGSVRLWDAATGQELAVLKGHPHVVWSIGFSPDGTRLASASGDKTVRIWDSVPHRTRVAECQAILSARSEVRQLVDQLWQQQDDAKTVAEVLRVEASLTEPQRRAALNLLLEKSSRLESERYEHVKSLYARLVFTTDVVAVLEADDSLAPSVRHNAVKRAQARGDSPRRVIRDSRRLLNPPGGEPEAYRIGLRGAEASVADEPDNVSFLVTLGVAQYRNGRYEEAYATSLRCDKLWQQEFGVSTPFTLAVTAMALFRLERTEEAKAVFAELEGLMTGEWKDNKDAILLFEESKRLLSATNVRASH
jgi:Tol biopolymer transport system component